MMKTIKIGSLVRCMRDTENGMWRHVKWRHEPFTCYPKGCALGHKKTIKLGTIGMVISRDNDRPDVLLIIERVAGGYLRVLVKDEYCWFKEELMYRVGYTFKEAK